MPGISSPDISRIRLRRIADMTVFPGDLGCSFGRLPGTMPGTGRTSSPCDVLFKYASGPIPRCRGTIARWHAHLSGLATAIEAPCPALVQLKRDRESSKCKVVIPFYCSSLAPPVRLGGLRGMCSLEHFHETSGLDEEDSNEIWAIPPEKAMHLASVIYGLDSHR